MHPDRLAFLNAIQATPEDDLPRLVFADWLDEHGETDLDFATAEWIRFDCRAMEEPKRARGHNLHAWGAAPSERPVPRTLTKAGGIWLRANAERLVPRLSKLTDEWTAKWSGRQLTLISPRRLGTFAQLALLRYLDGESVQEATRFSPRVEIGVRFSRGFVENVWVSAVNTVEDAIFTAIKNDQPLAQCASLITQQMLDES